MANNGKAHGLATLLDLETLQFTRCNLRCNLEMFFWIRTSCCLSSFLRGAFFGTFGMARRRFLQPSRRRSYLVIRLLTSIREKSKLSSISLTSVLSSPSDIFTCLPIVLCLSSSKIEVAMEVLVPCLSNFGLVVIIGLSLDALASAKPDEGVESCNMICFVSFVFLLCFFFGLFFGL